MRARRTRRRETQGRDVEVMRSYLKVAKRSKLGKSIRIGAKVGKISEQATYLKQQLEQFFTKTLKCDVFKPRGKPE